MSSRVFQSVVLQLKESTSRTIGVIDINGTIVACSELSRIGETLSGAVELLAAEHGGMIIRNGNTFKALNGAKTYFEEKHDKAAFVKSILSDNILLGDIYLRAKELHFVSEVPRAVFLVRQEGSVDVSVIDVVQGLYPDRQTDYVISISETDVALVKQVTEATNGKDLYKIAKSIEEAVSTELKVKVVIGIGTIVSHVRDLARAYQEAQMAIEVGKVFENERSVINYENLGIGRLIYQLPTTLCEMFLQEVFKKNPIDSLDQETLFTIYKFFENNLNVSETARKLFVHRNTLVYRLEKIKKLTGLDLREFDDAITFKVALMVKKYLTSRGIDA